jgi:glyoxylase-like metal-dependent hydrolase (beta-lactamase superfamily II)
MLGRTILLKQQFFRTIKTSAAFAFITSATALTQLPMVFTSVTANLEICQFSCLGDNYGYLLHDTKTGSTAAIDTPDATAYTNVLRSKGWTLTHIFNTHHHWE